MICNVCGFTLNYSGSQKPNFSAMCKQVCWCNGEPICLEKPSLHQTGCQNKDHTYCSMQREVQIGVWQEGDAQISHISLDTAKWEITIRAGWRPVGDCLQDWTTNTLTRNPDFFYFIDHWKTSLPAQDYKVPFYLSSCSTVSFVTVNHWFVFQLKGSKVQGYHIPTCSLSPLHLTFSQFTLFIIKTKL